MQLFSRLEANSNASLKLQNGSRVAVMGGGPAGSFFSYFLLDLAERVGLDIKVDVYEPRDFSLPAPKGCNMCAGVISETLIQNLATEGINLNPPVIQKAINSYILHMDSGSQKIDAPLFEKRIGTVYRGSGPQGSGELGLRSFDGHLLSLAEKNGANVIHQRVTGVERASDRIRISTRNGSPEEYDLLAVASGVNSSSNKLFENGDFKYRPPKTTKTALAEYLLGREAIEELFGDSLHVFLLDIPRLDFAMLVPKGDYLSVCLLGSDVDEALVQSFLDAPEVKSCFPREWSRDQPVCRCYPRINVQASDWLFADRIVFIGDIGFSRLYKDGIGAAYRAAKSAAATAILEGISAKNFQHHYGALSRTIEVDNLFGRIVFAVAHLFQKIGFSRKAVLKMIANEQSEPGAVPRMSSILWDTFTGSAPYLDVFRRTLQPAFVGRFTVCLARSLFGSKSFEKRVGQMERNGLGKIYRDSEVIVKQGDQGDCMYVIQEGSVEVVKEMDGKEMVLALLRAGEFFGEMAIFEREVRSATVRALGEARVLTIDKKNFLRRVHEDPSMAFRLVQAMSSRIRELNDKVARNKLSQE